MCRAAQVVIVPESAQMICVVPETLAQFVRDHLRLHRHVLPRGALLHQRHPLTPLRGLQPAAVGLAVEQWDQPPQHPDRIADEADLDRIAQSDPRRVEVYLHGARLTGLRVELDVGEAAADDQQGVAAFQRLLRRARAQQADATGAIGAVVGHAGLAQDRLGDRRAEDLGRFFQLLAGAEGAAPGQNDRPPAAVQQVGGAAQCLLGRDVRAVGPDLGDMVRQVALRAQGAGRHRLHVHRHRHVRDAAIGERGAASQLDGVLHMRRAHDPVVVLGDVDVELVELDVLLRLGM